VPDCNTVSGANNLEGNSIASEWTRLKLEQICLEPDILKNR